VRYLLFISLVFLPITSMFAQSEHTLGFMENVYQSTYSNPTAIPATKLNIGLPGISSIYGGVTNSGFSFKNIYGRESFNIDNGIHNLRKKNYIYAGVNVDLFHIQLKAKNGYFSFHIAEKANMRFSYPKDLLALAWQGNYQFAGSKADLSSLGVDFNYYREYALGYIKESKKWNIGGKVKFLQGIANAHVRNKGLGLNVAKDSYDLSVSSDVTLNTSGLDTDPSDLNARKYLTRFDNKGLAFDLGTTYKHSDKLSFSASINNIGFIRWTSMLKNYNVKGGTSFQGYQLSVPSNDTTSSNNPNYLDSLKNNFKYTETSKKYTTWVIPQFYLRVKYNLTKGTILNASFSIEKYKAFRTATTLGITQKVGRVFNILLTYTWQYRSYDNFGIGVMVKPGPVQLYFVSDYILRTYTNYTDKNFTVPATAKAMNVRVGMNLVFGRVRTQEQQTIPKKLR
jgi:hypothetical protein